MTVVESGTSAPTAVGRLLSALHATGGASRAEATASARLARSAAGAAVEELLELGIISQGEPIASEARGRPSPVLTLRRPGLWVVAAELRVDVLRMSAVRLGREVVQTRTVPLDTQGPPEVTIAAVGEQLTTFVRSVDVRCVGVALSLPGMVDRRAGVATTILSLDWHDVPVCDLLAPSLPDGLPIAIAQDAACAAIGEHRAGAGAGSDRFLFLLGQAVGVGGLVVGSQSEWSTWEHPLQAGHVIVDPSGPECLCGSRGCLEVFVDGRAIARALGEPQPVSPERFRTMVASGLSETHLAALQHSVVPRLRTGLISLVNVLSPHRVVMGGVLAPLLDLAEAELRSGLALSVVAEVEHVSLMPSVLEDPVILGAAELAFAPLFRDPRAVLARVVAA